MSAYLDRPARSLEQLADELRAALVSMAAYRIPIDPATAARLVNVEAELADRRSARP